MPDFDINDLTDALFILPDDRRRQAFLRAHDLWRSDVLADLLSRGQTLARQEPDHCRRLAAIIRELADGLGAAAIAAEAEYLQGQANALLGDFNAAIANTEAARARYLAQGQTGQAARTYVGQMHALAALGRYDEALAAGDAALELGGTSDLLLALVVQNRGMVLHRQGRFDEALAAYASAAEIYGQQGQTLRQGEAFNNQGVVLLSLGRGSEAAEAFEQAETAFAAAAATLLTGLARSNQGAAHLLTSDYQQALADFEAARQLFDSLEAAETATLMLDMASAYLALNLHPEALDACDQALDAFRAADRPYEIAQAELRRAAALLRLGRPLEAQAALAAAAERFQALDNLPWTALVRLEQAALWQQAGRRSQAQNAAAEALAVYETQGMAAQTVYAHLRLAELAADPDEAETHWLAAQAQADELTAPTLRYRALAGLGRLRRSQSRWAEAESHLSQAVDLLETQRATLAHDLLRASFLGDKGRPYADLTAVLLARDGPNATGAAFDLAERGRARSLLDRLGLAAGSEDSRGPLAVQQQALTRQLDALYSALLNSDLEQSEAAQREAILARIREIEQALGNLRLRIASRGGKTLAAGQVATTADVQTALPADAALVSFQQIDDEWLAFVVTRDAVRTVRNLCRAGWLAGELDWLAVQWQRFSFGPQHTARHRALALRSTQARLRRLYERLIAPLALTASRVVIVPQGPLHGLPFHALHDGRGYWLEQVEVSYAASASLFVWAERQPSRSLERALALGLADAGIPQVKGELEALAAAFPSAQVLRDDAATETALRAAAGSCDLLHLACHGVFRADNPMFSALRLADGWLTAEKAGNLPLSAALVTLSACQSGRSQVLAGDELLGLARPFLTRAASLVVSLWLVHDETAARLMAQFYREIAAGRRPAAALRQAQLMTLSEEPHPYYWAPFVAMGQVTGQEE